MRSTLMLSLLLLLLLASIGCDRGRPPDGRTLSGGAAPAPPITVAQYERLELGMTREQVEAIVGRAGQSEEVSDAPPATESYNWTNLDGSSVSVDFEGGKAASIQQTGLKE